MVKIIKTVKGYQYCVTANEEVSITDDYGMDLTCPAGQQTYFVANANEAYVIGDANITQTRWGFIAGGKGGGGETIQPGEVIIGGTQGSYSWLNMNEVRQLPFALPPHLPEGVTLENLETTAAQPNFTCDRVNAFSGVEDCELPASMNLRNLYSADFGFNENTYIKRINASDGLFRSDGHIIVADYMFTGCTNLESFEGDLSWLGYGSYMFYGTKLRHFRTTKAMNNLYGASEMFGQCKLDLASLQHLATMLGRPMLDRQIHIGYDANTVSMQQAQSVQAILVGKGWTVTMQRNY